MATFHSFLDGASCVITKFQAALKILASAGMLFRNPDTGYEHRFKDYYWLNDNHLENIDGVYRELSVSENTKSFHTEIPI